MKSFDLIIDRLCKNLLRAIKKDFIKRKKPLNYNQLRKEGYPDKIIKYLQKLK